MNKKPLEQTAWPRVLAAIQAYQAEHGGLSPSLREIAWATGLSIMATSYLLERAEQEGIISRPRVDGRAVARIINTVGYEK